MPAPSALAAPPPVVASLVVSSLAAAALGDLDDATSRFASMVDLLAYFPLLLLFVGIAIYLRHILRVRRTIGGEAASLEEEFEARLLSEVLGTDASVLDAPSAPSALRPLDAPSAFGVEASPRPSHLGADAPASTPPSAADAAIAANVGAAQPVDDDAHVPLADVVAQLRRLRADLTDAGPVANLGGAPGTGLALTWDRGRRRAVLVAELPPAHALPNLLRRFDAVVVAPPSTATEPLVIDRASAYLLADLRVQ